MSARGHNKGKARERVARWRQANRRIDYAPSAAALRVILHCQGKVDATLAGTIDRLVLAGYRAISGNG